MLLAVNIARWILGIVGSLSLVMFIYGGFMFLISGGSSESVQKAKKIILAAVIGLIIVFCSWLIIRFVLKTLNPNINWTGQELIVNKLK
jgi:phosphotransferase system  glucose/maltose/N-acetylglucosamine-specific IIC component